jgi:chemotaxis signal transduction protein
MASDSVLFEVEGRRLAADLALAREAVPLGQVTPMPTAPPEVLGVTQVRGQVLPLLDLPRLLGGRAAAPRLGDVALLVRVGDTAALLCGATALSTGSASEADSRIDLVGLLRDVQRRVEERPR